MKNIHILPTDKPSRLYLTTHEYIFEEGYSLSTDECENKNIYITSDEEIKEGDWFLCLDNGKCNDSIYKANEAWLNMEEKQPSYCKKIILTTDQDLIKDGVQAIDDDFLEWFVNNSSCEEIFVNTIEGFDFKLDKYVYDYKIIIPKQEQKQHLIDMMNDDEDLGLYNETFDEYLIRLKDRRTEDNYKYTDEDFEKYDEYIMDSWRCGMSVYKCLEFMYFAEKEIKVEDVFNDEKRDAIKEFISNYPKALTIDELIDQYIEETGYGMDMWSKEETNTFTTIKNILYGRN
jgi:hypothetical protein